jgi:hypothetical protein
MAVDELRPGRMVVQIVEMPIKCRVAPLEGAFTEPVASRYLGPCSTSGRSPWRRGGKDEAVKMRR